MAEERATELVQSLRRRITELEAQCARVPTNKGAPINSAHFNGGHGRLNHEELTQSISVEDILANLTEAFIVLDCDWRITYVNAEAERINKKKAKDFLGKTHWEEWPLSVGTEVEWRYRRAMSAREPERFEYFYEDSYNLWLEIHAFPCKAGLAVLYRDITERKRIEIELKKREEELTDFIENATVALHWVGPNGTILWANEAEAKLLGYAREEYIGRNIREFHADEATIEDILSRLTNREELHDYEARLRCKDGSIRYVAISSSVFREDERFIRTRCFTRDITDKKIAEEALFRLGAIVESSDDAIISKDLNGMIRTWNRGAERIFGYTAEEVIGKHISMLAVPERVDEIPSILNRIRRGERVDHYVTKRRTKEGRILTVSLTVSPIRDASGAIIGASKIARDITEREESQEVLRATNEALRVANSDLEQFAYAAAHDLKEPLRMVNIYCQLLEKKFAEIVGTEGQQYLRYAIEGSSRMEALVRDLLTYLQASTPNSEPVPRADPNRALEDALVTLRAVIEETGASITVSQLPAVRIHEVHLQQLFQNLLGNAIKYRSDTPPRIAIGAEQSGEGSVFFVQDNGIGIDPEYKEQIFGLFKRLHTTNEYSGSGIGLALCKRIVERYGGRIWVESELRRGATFFFTIPAG
jgi:PAS domain S-box-containing protein